MLLLKKFFFCVNCSFYKWGKKGKKPVENAQSLFVLAPLLCKITSPSYSNFERRSHNTMLTHTHIRTHIESTCAVHVMWLHRVQQLLFIILLQFFGCCSALFTLIVSMTAGVCIYMCVPVVYLNVVHDTAKPMWHACQCTVIYTRFYYSYTQCYTFSSTIRTILCFSMP